jgi:hypothetical protein
MTLVETSSAGGSNSNYFLVGTNATLFAVRP